jgi:hypothetical protein
VAQHQRRHSSFILDALVVVEVNVSVNQIIGFMECLGFVPVDTLCFWDGEKFSAIALSYGLPFLDIDGVMP